MKWSNVKLIFLREVRDQLRDRRTLFTIAVLPLLLYPLLGMSFLQVSQFMHEQPSLVWLVGANHLPDEPRLLDNDRFAENLGLERDTKLVKLDVPGGSEQQANSAGFRARAHGLIREGKYAAVVRIPAGFAESLSRFRLSVAHEPASSAPDGEQLGGEPFPAPEIIFDAANEKSRITSDRVRRVLLDWRREIVQVFLANRNIPPKLTEPFDIRDVDVSEEMSRRAALWSKILPFVVFVWALTGAFYPAVDLCAGEKERGTLETLLSSPAARGEIVLGKLLTIMGFSAATSLLNLVSMAVTGAAIILLQPTQIPIGPPPVLALGWLLLGLLPISALFSALSLAIAAFARSTKEGQYYLMPLLLVSLPLMILPMLPSVELELGTSLVPITGMMLLLRALVEGQYAEAAVFMPPVIAVTAACCYVAIRWAVNQFNNESVLFRESDRLDLRLWIRHVFRTRGLTPTFAQAIACGVVLLTIRFFAMFAAPQTKTWNEFAVVQFLTLAVLIAVPVLLMTWTLTRSTRATLLLNIPRPTRIVMAGLLAIALHPIVALLSDLIRWLYPFNEEVTRQLTEVQQVVTGAPSVWAILGLMALTPAIFEEMAFRGFILSGLRHIGNKWAAIIISALFFGMTHGILQQSISTVVLGLIIGYIAVQTGSLIPCIVFHLVSNSLSLLTAFWVVPGGPGSESVRWLFTINGDDFAYHWPAVLVGATVSLLILWWFHRLTYTMTAEERLREVVNRKSASAAAA